MKTQKESDLTLITIIGIVALITTFSFTFFLPSSIVM